MLNIVLIEDDPIFRAEMESTIHFQPDWYCVLSSPSAEHFRKNFPSRSRIDIAFVDVNLPGESGIDLLPFLIRRAPNAEIIIVSQIEDSKTLLQALNCGANGYLLKDFSMFQLPQFVKIILDGGALISPSMARHLINYLNPKVSTVPKVDALTPKEEQVLRLMSEGNTYEEAATLLDITIDGIRFYIKKIYKKLGVRKRNEALKLWKEMNKNEG